MTHSLAMLAICSFSTHCSAGQAYVEFLWAIEQRGALARSETSVLTLDQAEHHRICIVAPIAGRKALLRIDAMDPSGAKFATREYPDYDGKRRCYPPAIGSGSYGEWQFQFYLNGESSGTRSIEVAPTITASSAYLKPGQRFVAGRPNYNRDIPPEAYSGRIVWEMAIDRQGIVQSVQISDTEGAGDLMKDRALAAGYLTRFSPDPSLGSTLRTVSQEYVFRPD